MKIFSIPGTLILLLLITALFVVGNAEIEECDRPGIPVCTYEHVQCRPEIISDGEGGAFIAWNDGRYGYYDNDVWNAYNNIFIQRIDSYGNVLWQLDYRLVLK
jgi:hypothetical protein